jgi:hypothetical protein
MSYDKNQPVEQQMLQELDAVNPLNTDKTKACTTVCKYADAAPSASFLEAQMCEGRGGAVGSDGSCQSFLQVTSTFISPKNASIEEQCEKEYGSGYQACSAVQALGLAHVYSVPDHSHYWLKPDDLSLLRLKAVAAESDDAGMCSGANSLALKHNWDAKSVDSQVCLHESNAHRVVCCRKNA